MNRHKNQEDEVPTIHFRIADWFPDLDPKKIEKLKLLHDELIRFNRTINLISAKTLSNADCVHFADSILASRIIKNELTTTEIYDFGSGNGFPGLVFSILYPEINVIMVDADQRKCEYLKHISTHLRLSNATTMIKQIETLAEGSISTAMARGYASIPKSILATRKIFRRSGSFFHLKSEEWASEVASIPTQLCSFWMPSLCSEYKLPLGEVRYAVVKTVKIAD